MPTAPEGTSERKAIGSVTMKASRETARTSRAAAPSAAPAAPSAAPPATIASQPERRSGSSCSGTKICMPAEHQQGDGEADADPEHDLLAEQGRGGDEAPGEAREGVLLPLQRQRAGDQEDGDEGEGQGRGDGDREDVERRGGAFDDLLVDFDRLREAVDQRLGDVEVVAGEGGEADHPVERGAQRPGRQRRPQRGRGSSPVVLQAEDFDRLADDCEVAAVDEQVDEPAAFAGDPPRDQQVRLGQQGGDPVVDRLPP